MNPVPTKSGNARSPMTSKLRPIIGLLFLALLVLAASAQGQVLQAPWNVTLVVDNGAAMAQPWLGTIRATVVESALQLELRTMPLRARVGVWLANEG